MAATPETAFSGDLRQLPLFGLLRRIQLARRSGTLKVTRNGEQRHLWFEDGELRAARSSKREHSLGSSLIQWGYVDQAGLERALELQRNDGGRLGALFVELGLVPRSVVDAEARRLMEQIVSSALSWAEGRFDFEPRSADTSAEDVQIDLSVTAMIVEGIRRVPESEKFLQLLGDPSRVPSISNPDGKHHDAHLPPEASAILALVDGRRDVRAILALSPGSSLANAKILFTMAFCGFVELAAVTATGPATAEALPAGEGDRPTRTIRNHRSLILTTYRRIDWLSDYDLLGVSAEAQLPEIEDAYQRVSVLFDPTLRERADLSDCGRQLTILSQRAREAYDTLANPERRAVYDRKTRTAQTLLANASNPDPATECPSDASSPDVRRDTAEANYRHAVVLVEKGDPFPAIEMLEEAVRFFPEEPRYLALLGISKLGNRWWRAEALEHLESAARLEPQNHETRATLAEAYLEQGDPDLGLPHARMALNAAPPEQKPRFRDLETRIEAALAAPKSRKTPAVTLKRSA